MPLLETNGARIAYSRTGAGPVVLLVQGVGVPGEGWRPQIDALADRYTLVAFDNRGLGASPLAGGEVSIEAMADDALAVMDAEGIRRFHVVGHSMGGLIAQEIALRVPDRATSLALLCTFASGAQGARMTPALFLTALRMRLGPRRLRRNAFLGLVMPKAYLRETDRAALADRLAALFGYDLADQPLFVLKQVRAMSRYAAGDRLRSLARIPTLVASATFDRIALPTYGRALAAAIPGARYVELPAAGHAVTIQRADEVNALLAAHFAAAPAGG
jgi:3-oxoadipate enol-lactonase